MHTRKQVQNDVVGQNSQAGEVAQRHCLGTCLWFPAPPSNPAQLPVTASKESNDQFGLLWAPALKSTYPQTRTTHTLSKGTDYITDVKYRDSKARRRGI